MMFFSKPPKPEPVASRVNQRGLLRQAVDQAVRNALDGYRSTEWGLYRDVANDLDAFARQVRMSAATRKPL